MNFGNLNYFLGIKKIRKRLKRPHSTGLHIRPTVYDTHELAARLALWAKRLRRPTAHGHCGPAQAGAARWAVTAPRADAAARLVAAHRWPRWEEVAGTSKRGPRTMRQARRGVVGLTEVARHH
jgi:hypothetical protein